MPVDHLRVLIRDRDLPDELAAEALIDGTWQPVEVGGAWLYHWRVYGLELAEVYPDGTQFRTYVREGDEWSGPSNELAVVPEPSLAAGLAAGALLLAILKRFK